MELLNTNLKWLRNAFSFSLKDLSKNLDIKISTLNSYEDNTFPRIDTLQKIIVWYSQAIPNLTIDDVINSKLEEKYPDLDFDYFEEVKSSSGYKSKKNSSVDLPNKISEIEIERLKLEVFNNILKLATEENVDIDMIKELISIFKDKF